MSRFSQDLTQNDTTPTETHSIRCTGDVVVGDHIRFNEAVFGGSHRRPVFEGIRVVEARVVRDSYGKDKQQHTFTLEITSSSGCEPLETGAVIRRKGRNVYRNTTYRKPWDDESQRGLALKEKHLRGDNARAARHRRRERQWID